MTEPATANAPPQTPQSPRTLRDIALARSGDKGNRATLSVIAHEVADFAVLDRLLTVEQVQAVYAAPPPDGLGLPIRHIERYVLPQLGAVHFVMHGALGGGVTRSLALDAHGKSLSAWVLALPLPAQGPSVPGPDPGLCRGGAPAAGA